MALRSGYTRACPYKRVKSFKNFKNRQFPDILGMPVNVALILMGFLRARAKDNLCIIGDNLCITTCDIT